MWNCPPPRQRCYTPYARADRGDGSQPPGIGFLSRGRGADPARPPGCRRGWPERPPRLAPGPAASLDSWALADDGRELAASPSQADLGFRRSSWPRSSRPGRWMDLRAGGQVPPVTGLSSGLPARASPGCGTMTSSTDAGESALRGAMAAARAAAEDLLDARAPGQCACAAIGSASTATIPAGDTWESWGPRLEVSLARFAEAERRLDEAVEQRRPAGLADDLAACRGELSPTLRSTSTAHRGRRAKPWPAGADPRAPQRPGTAAAARPTLRRGPGAPADLARGCRLVRARPAPEDHPSRYAAEFLPDPARRGWRPGG